MVGCTRCCVHTSMRAVNLFVNLCGVGVIIYSLWLIKKWQVGVSELPSVSYIPKPWFIYTCLGVGMAVCLSTLCGHIVAHRSSSSILFIYIISIFSLLCLEVSVIVAIFYKTNWQMQLAKFIDKKHIKFKEFLIFHVNLCRLIVILILVPQIKVIVLAAILWVIGAEPRAHCNDSEIPNLRYSFLAAPTQSILDVSRHGFRNYEASPRESFSSYVNRIFRMQFHRRVSLS
ncbi:PREDICTED: tetraspanin-19-like isoform X2 [Prunus mume]|uniref:Tetraspanin-19-like isoform X2 n=1 Tax=Prunus mume TaxID=102107 RepID=A0ABM0N5Z8_PRUMU|nr:PREDICTED: tetraspanin-19-like isoform X2 [Prunus mume]